MRGEEWLLLDQRTQSMGPERPVEFGARGMPLQPKSRGSAADFRATPRCLTKATGSTPAGASKRKKGMRKTTPTEAGNEMVELGEVM
jgi:hypothetical protein